MSIVASLEAYLIPHTWRDLLLGVYDGSSKRGPFVAVASQPQELLLLQQTLRDFRVSNCTVIPSFLQVQGT